MDFFRILPSFLIKGLPALFVASLTLTSCLPEQKVAQTFIKAGHGINLLVFDPELVFKYNHKGETIEGFDTLRGTKADSALWVNSKYVQYLSDSILLESYMNRFISELRDLGFRVYLGTSIDSFMTGKPQSYVLNLAQMQIDEYLYPVEDEETFQDTTYYKKFELNAVDFSCWFELSMVNSPKSRKTLLYSSSTGFDTFEGQFYLDPWSNVVKYRYQNDTLTVSDIYDMARYLGNKHAGYLYDYFLNQYIARNLPENEEAFYYYHYNRVRKTLTPVNEDCFEVLGTK